MIRGSLYFLVVFICFIAVPVQAMVLESIANVSIQDVSIDKTDLNTFSVSYTTLVTSLSSYNGVRQGIYLQNTSGDVVYLQSYEDLNITEDTTVKSTVTFSPLSVDSGVYDVFIVLKNKASITIATAFAGEVNIEKGLFSAALTSCDYSEDTITCLVKGDAAKLHYEVKLGGLLGESVVSEDINLNSGKQISIEVESLNLPSGRYGVILNLFDSNGNLAPSQQRIVLTISGNWIALSGFSSRVAPPGIFIGDLYLNGVGESNVRGFKYWIIDDSGEVCISGEVDLEQQIPRKRTIREEVGVSCNQQRLVGFLYDGKNPDGTYLVIDQIGDVSFVDFLRQDKKSEYFTQILNLYSFPAIILIVFVFIIVRKMKKDV